MDKVEEEKTNIKGRIKRDEILKMLFSVSRPLVINAVNYFFNENYEESKEYEIEFLSTESTDLDLQLRRPDIIIKIEKAPRFHLEFQLSKDKLMILRMFEYGYKTNKIWYNRDNRYNSEINGRWESKQRGLYENNWSNQVLIGIFFRKLWGLEVIEGGVRGEWIYLYKR